MPIIANCCVCGTYIPWPHNKTRRYCGMRCYRQMHRKKYEYTGRLTPKRRWPEEYIARWNRTMSGSDAWKRLRALMTINHEKERVTQ